MLHPYTTIRAKCQYKCTPNSGQLQNANRGFHTVKLLGQLANSVPTLWISGSGDSDGREEQGAGPKADEDGGEDEDEDGVEDEEDEEDEKDEDDDDDSDSDDSSDGPFNRPVERRLVTR